MKRLVLPVFALLFSAQAHAGACSLITSAQVPGKPVPRTQNFLALKSPEGKTIYQAASDRFLATISLNDDQTQLTVRFLHANGEACDQVKSVATSPGNPVPLSYLDATGSSCQIGVDLALVSCHQ